MIYNLLYIFLSFFIIILDRITKYFAVNYLAGEYKINDFLSFDLVINRGFSWGIFNSDKTIIFIVITMLIILVTMVVGIHGYLRLKQKRFIIGEVLVCAGSLSNIIDRIYYGGVIDFIIVWMGKWPFPAFNIADSAVVIGIIYLLMELFFDPENNKNEISNII